MRNKTACIFSAMTLLASGMMVFSFSLPWWIGKFSENTAINLYGWGLRHNLIQFAGRLENDLTPLYQTVLAWAYIGLSVALILFSIFTKRKKIAILIQGIVGAGYIVYALSGMYLVIEHRLSDFGIALQGESIPYGGELANLMVQSSIQPAFYLALATGVFIVILAIIRFVFYKR